MRPPDEIAHHDDDSTPVLVSGLLAGIGGGALGFAVTALPALVSSGDPFAPSKLVAAALMGPQATDAANSFPAASLGVLVTLLFAATLGVLFTWMRRRERRLKLLIAEGIGFGLVLYGAMYIVLPYLDGAMYERQPKLPLALAYALFGATLALELPLRMLTFEEPDVIAGRPGFSLSHPPP